jgi:DNA-binding NarL/FixJ family response regulator
MKHSSISPRETMKILIVEDSPTDRELLRYLLEDKFREEAKFREADSLDTAIRYLSSGSIDCVVLDLQLPDSAGKETFLKLIARFPDIPIIVMTHNKDRNLALEMIKAGAADYVLKNYTDPEDIFRRIVFAVEKHRRTVRMSPERAAAVHKLERAQANMLTAHQSGELTSQITQSNVKNEQIGKTVEALETEILKGSGGRPSMRSQVDILDHRIGEIERRFSDFRELTEKKIEQTDTKAEQRIGAIRTDLKTSEDQNRLSAVQIQQTHMTNRTKVLIAILSLLGAVVAAVLSYEASKKSSSPAPTQQER